METLLLCAIVLLSVAVCALGGFWFYRAARANKPDKKPTQAPRSSAAGPDPWQAAVRPSRDKI